VLDDLPVYISASLVQGFATVYPPGNRRHIIIGLVVAKDLDTGTGKVYQGEGKSNVAVYVAVKSAIVRSMDGVRLYTDLIIARASLNVTRAQLDLRRLLENVSFHNIDG
jgi:hypothetical protein